MRIHIDDDKKEIIKSMVESRAIHQQNRQDLIVSEPSDIAESLRQLNDDTVEESTGMSNIDMRSRLVAMEIDGLMVVDVLTSFGVLPAKCLQFSRQKKRLAVSLEGRGRSEIIDLFRGQNEQDITRRNPLQKLFGMPANNNNNNGVK